MAENALRVSLIGIDKSLSKTISGASKNVETAASKMAVFGERVQRIGHAMTLGITLPVVAGFTMATKAAIDEQKEMALLDQAIRKNTDATAEQVAAVEKWITKTQNWSGIADGELRPALAALVRSTKDTGKAQQLLATAMDISVAKGKPLQTVADAIAKAYAGNTSALGRLGIGMKDAEGKALTFDQVMARAKDTFGGASAKAADTTAGRLAIMKAKMSDLAESIGSALIPMLEQITAVILPVIDGFNSMSNTQQTIIVGVGLFAAALGPLLSVVGTLARGILLLNSAYEALLVGQMANGVYVKAGIVQMTILKAQMIAQAVASKVAAAAQWLWNAAMSANPIGLIIVAIAALVTALVILYKKNETFRKIVDAVWKAIKTVVSVVVKVIVAYVRQWWRSLQELKPVFSTIKSAASKAFGAIKTVIGKVVDAVKWLWEKCTWIKGKLDSLHIPNPFTVLTDALGRIIKLAGDAWSAIQKVLGAKGNMSTGGGAGGGGGGGGARAYGGIVTRPELSLIGEAGPEAIIPLTKPRRAAEILRQAGLLGAGGDTYITINLNGVFEDGTDAGEAAAEAFVRRSRALAVGY